MAFTLFPAKIWAVEKQTAPPGPPTYGNYPAPSPVKNISSGELDAFKGILFLFVMACHTTILLDASFLLFSRIPHFFHVFCFLLLPFLYPAPPRGLKGLGDRFVRYYHPFLLFFLSYSALYFAIFLRGANPSGWLRDAALGALIGSAPLVDKASGFEMFWFVPALLGIMILRSILPVKNGWGKYALLVGAFAVHGAIPYFPAGAVPYAPFGLLTGLYLLFPGLLLQFIWPLQGRDSLKRTATLCLPVFALLVLAGVKEGLHPYLPAFKIYGLREPLKMLLGDAIVLTSFFGIFGAAMHLSKSESLRFIGRNSFSLYLLHPLIQQAIYLALKKLGYAPSLALGHRYALGAAVFLLTLGVSSSAVAVLNSTPLWRFAFPKDLASLHRKGAGESG